MSEENDPFEDRLRAVLTASAEEVEPAEDGLSRIRGRIAERKRRSLWARARAQWLARPALAAGSSVGVIALGLTTAIGVSQAAQGQAPFGIGHGKTPSSAMSSNHGAASPTSKSTKPGGSHASTEPHKSHKPKAASVTVPVYRVVQTPGGYDVARSSTTVKVTGSRAERQEQRAEGAIKAVFSGGAGAVWQPGASYVDVDLQGGTLKVMLSSAARSGAVSSPEAARAALKQIVFTGLDAAPAASSVQILAGGGVMSPFWGILPVGPGGVSRGDSAITRPFNTITSPDDGSATVSSSVTLGGNGAYEGNQVHWQILDKGQVVRSGSQSTGTGFSDWSTTVDLQPGTYRLQTYDVSGGGQHHLKSVGFTVFE